MHRVTKFFFVVVLFALLAGGCAPEAAQPKALALPVTLFDAELEGHHVTIVLHSACEDLRPPEGTSQVEYCYQADVQIAESLSGKLRASIIQLELTEGYQKDETIQWDERIGDAEGAGAVWEEPGPHAFWLPFEPGADNHPVAVFLQIQTLRDEDQPLSMHRVGPVVLQLLPDGRGIARLDSAE